MVDLTLCGADVLVPRKRLYDARVSTLLRLVCRLTAAPYHPVIYPSGTRTRITSVFRFIAERSKTIAVYAGLTVAVAIGAHAQDLTGLCIDNIEGGCMGRYLNFYGNAVDFCESTCELTNPVAVRGLEATLYDFVCRSDNGDYEERVLLMFQTGFDGSRNLSMIDAEQTRSIVPCP